MARFYLATLIMNLSNQASLEDPSLPDEIIHDTILPGELLLRDPVLRGELLHDLSLPGELFHGLVGQVQGVAVTRRTCSHFGRHLANLNKQKSRIR